MPVTTQPQYVLLSGVFRVPSEGTDIKKLFYGDIREAKLPDRFMVDYVRVYQEDSGSRPSPVVTLRRKDGAGDVRPDGSASFEATASDASGKIENLLLFSNGRLRAEAATASEVFTLAGDRFFSGENVLIAMAKTTGGAVGISEPLTVRCAEIGKARASPPLASRRSFPARSSPVISTRVARAWPTPVILAKTPLERHRGQGFPPHRGHQHPRCQRHRSRPTRGCG